MLRLLSLLAAFALATAAGAQDTRSLTGTVTYLDRMALPADTMLQIEVIAPDGSVAAEARLPTEGRQVPIPFAVDLAVGIEGDLRAGLMLGGNLIWLGEPVAIDDASGDLGELVLQRHVPTGFASAFRCGDRVIRVGFAGDALVMDTGPDRLVMQSVPAGSGARYEVADDPDTFLWNHGSDAMISLGGIELPECRLSFPVAEAPYRAQGNEPFWSATVDAGELVLRRLGMEDLTLPVTETVLVEEGAILVTATDQERALRAVMLRRPAICRDTMTGMPYPETVELSMGDHTITGCGGASSDLLIGRDWMVEDIAGNGMIDDSRVTLTFGPDGRVAGSGGCNRWFAAYELTGEGMSIGQAGSTMMACVDALMTQERRFLDALGQVTGFDIDATGALVLLGPEGALVTARVVTEG